MRINHNISALNAYRNLSVNTANTTKSLEKLSSGLRINKASDDAAGLAISEKMRSQIRGLQTAERNALDGISLIQTAEGALSSVHEILQRMRELAVQASNDSYTDTDRAEIQKEVNQLTSEINRIGNSTEFNKAALLDGSRTNTFVANGISFSNGTSIFTDPATGVSVTITDGTVLSAGMNTISVTKVPIGPGNPPNITPVTSAVFGAYGDARSGEIGVTSLSIENDWTLTYVEGTPATFSGGGSSVSDATTGITASIHDKGAGLADGAHTLKVNATFVGEKFPGGVSNYSITPVASEISVTGSGSVSFAGDQISYGVNNGSPILPQGETVTLEYQGNNTFTISNSGNTVNDTYVVGSTYNQHGLNFKMDSESGMSVGDKVTFTIGSSSGTLATETTAFDAANTGNNKVTFDQPITVNSGVETGNWTITKEASGWKVEFAGVDQNGVPVNYTDTLANDSDLYNSHGLSFKVSTVDMATGDKLVFSTTAPEKYYDFSVELDGVSQTIASNVKGLGSAGNITSAESLSNFTGFPGLSIDGANLSEGQFNFTIDEMVSDAFTLTNSKGLPSVTIPVGQAFDDYGLQFRIDHPGTMTNGQSFNFATSVPPNAYKYEVSLNGGSPITVDPNVLEGEHPVLLAFSDFPGFELNSLELKEGQFQFDLKQSGTGQDNSLSLQIGANAGQTVSLEINDMRGQTLNISSAVPGGGEQFITLQNGDTKKVWYTTIPSVNNGVSDTLNEYAVDISSHEKASAAIAVFDDAIQRVSSERSRLGAIQNRLEYTIDNLKIMNENITSSESRIRDLDMAMEMTNFTKNNILNQAAQAMLSQANQLPQGVLQLLK